MHTDPLQFRDLAGCALVRAPSGLMVPVQTLHMAGVFTVECYDRHGRLRWKDTAANLITSAGLDLTLNVTLRDQTQVSTWYMSLVDNSGFTAFNAADTHASHAGWSENTQYSAGTRNTWSPGAPSSNTIVNGTTCDFVMSATATIKGMFIASDNTKGSTTSGVTLFSEAAFSAGNQACNSGDTLKCTYQVSASSP